MLFAEWICKLLLPQVVDTNLNKQQAEVLKVYLDTLLQQDSLLNPLIDTQRGSCFNQKAADEIK